MIFQASRFSASGRRVPLEPRRSEACRSCQPMHVLSFGEGRSVCLLFFVLRPRTFVHVNVWKDGTHVVPCFSTVFGLSSCFVVLSCDLGDTLRRRGEQCPLFLEWRFDWMCFVKKVQTYRVGTLWKCCPRVLEYPGYPQKVHFDALGDSKL